MSVDGVALDPTDEAVTAIDDISGVNEDDAITVFPSVLLNDHVPDLTHMVMLVSGPAEGLLVFEPGLPGAPDGSYSFDPNGDFEDLAEGETRDVTFVYEVQDADGDTDQATVTITVTGSNDAPIVTSGPADAAGAVSEAGNLDDNSPDTGVPSATGALTSGDVDNGATATWSGNAAGTYGAFAIDPATGVWSYTLDNASPATDALAEGQSETESFTATVTDEWGATASQVVTVTVNGTNDSPIAVDDTLDTVPAGWIHNPDNGHYYRVVEDPGTIADAMAGAASLGGYLATITSADEQAFIEQNGLIAQTDGTFIGGQTSTPWLGASATWSWAGGPEAGQQFGYTNWNPGEPNGGFGGSVGYAQLLQSGKWNDTPDAGQPGNGNLDGYLVEWAGPPSAATEDTMLQIATADLLANDTDVDNYLAAGEIATDSFTYTVTDEFGATDTATVTLTILGSNDAPVAVNDTGAVSEDGPGIIVDLLGNDSDPDSLDLLSIDSFDFTGLDGTVTDNGNGTITYDPNGAFEALNAGDSAIDSFSYTVTDGNGGTGTATVDITINGENDGPLASNDLATTDEDTTTFINVLVNDLGFAGGKTITGFNGGGTTGLSTSGAGLSVQFGQVVYDPQQSATLQALEPGQQLADTFTYSMQDGLGNVSTASVTVNVDGLAEPIIIDSGVNTVVGFDTLTGFPGSYTEDNMTVTSLYPGSAHLHDSGDDILNHSGCCSTPYEFTYNNAGDTSFSLQSITNVSGSGLWTSSAGGSQFVAATGTVNFGSDFENVEWVRWDESSGSNVIDDFAFAA